MLPSGSVVVGQLGQSLDGRIALPNGASRYINGPGALLHLHRLRAEVDAVLVGVGTLVADDPQLTVRRCAGRSPARILLDPSQRAPAAARLFADDGAPVVVVRAAGAAGRTDLPAHVRDLPIASGGGRLPPSAIVAALRGLGFGRLLIEGGANTISSFLEAGALDRLHLLVAPMILGSGRAGLEMPPIVSLSAALRPATQVTPLGGGDVLFDCDLRRAARGETQHV